MIININITKAKDITKDILRDITNQVDTMTTVEELKGATCEPSA